MPTLLHLLSGIALLVWGTHIVRTGILRVYGPHLRRILSQGLSRPTWAFGAGIFVTSLVQSSNATALLVLSFVGQGLVELPMALSIMLGADVGTALMARVLTFDLSWLFPLLTLVGVSLFLSRQRSRTGQLGRVLIGLGLIILALELIVEAAEPITTAKGMEVLFSSLAGDTLLAALFGALFAIVSYSSLAAVILTATLAGTGLLGLPVALGIVIGASIGSGFIAWTNARFQSSNARQLALGNLLFKTAGLLLLPFLDILSSALSSLPLSAASEVIGFHLAYNLIRTLLQLPLVEPMCRLCRQLIPERKSEPDVATPKHLDSNVLGSPGLALTCAVRETLRIGDLIDSMLSCLRNSLHQEDPELEARISRLDDDIDALYNAVKFYLAQISREELAAADNRRWAQTLELTVNLELAGDIIEWMAIKLRHPKTGSLREFSAQDLQELAQMLRQLADNLRLGLSVFLAEDTHSARRLIEQKHSFRYQERSLAHAHVERLSQQASSTPEISSTYLELLADIRRLNSLVCSPAYAVMESVTA